MKMLQIPKHSLVALLLAVMCSAASALTLQAGQYKLEWKIPRWDEAVVAPTKVGPLKPIDPNQLGKITGLKSGRALLAEVEGRAVILDESAGDGSGYDTAYVLASYKPGDAVDLSTAARLKLLNQGSLSISEESDPAVIDLTLGCGDSKLVREAGLRVQVAMRQNDDKENVPHSTALTTFGNWAGKIPSDQGDVEIQVIDQNTNGLFNDNVTFNAETSANVVGDLLALRGGETKKLAPLGPGLVFADKLYKITVSAAGDTVDIQPFATPSGVLKFETLDGKGKIVQTGESVMFMSTALGGVELKSGEQAPVPVGDYRPLPSLTFGARKKQGDPGFIATVKTTRTAKVEADKTTTFTLGGPVSMKIDPDVTTLQWTAGKETVVKAFIFAGEDELRSLGYPDPIVTLMIRDGAGRAVGRARPKMGLGNPRYFGVRVFDYLKPGPYWVDAAFEPGEYAPGATVTADKAVNIVGK